MDEREPIGWIAATGIDNDTSGKHWEPGDAIDPAEHSAEGWAGLVACGAVVPLYAEVAVDEDMSTEMEAHGNR